MSGQNSGTTNVPGSSSYTNSHTVQWKQSYAVERYAKIHVLNSMIKTSSGTSTEFYFAVLRNPWLACYPRMQLAMLAVA